MDYYQGVVLDYLRADRCMFVNDQFCLQINEADNPDVSGPHWYVDALAVNMKSRQVFLCEISYAANLDALLKRLLAWRQHWGAILTALNRDAHLPEDWPVRPWVFIPEKSVERFVTKLAVAHEDIEAVPAPIITTLEMTQPWQYRSWRRQGEVLKPGCIPAEMQM